MRTFILLFCTTVFSFAPKGVFSQNTKVTVEKDIALTVDEVFDLIRKQTDYTFMFKSGLFKDTPKVRLKKGTIKANELLEKILSTKDYNFQVKDNLIVITKNKSKSTKDPIKVTGKVTDESGMPLAGVTVRISGTNIGVATSFDGSYTIGVSGPATVLVFSSIGYATQEIIIGKYTVIDVTMKEALSQLDEVVLNAGYYNVSERTKTGNIAKIEAKTIEKQPVNNPLAAMQGHLSGVDIVQTTGVPGGGFTIAVRGKNFINGGTDPLFIVDGVPYGSESLESGSVSFEINGGNTSPLNAINPTDIENIEVLKDADATAIYGSRGANGVVLITTKKGKAGKTKVAVNLSNTLGEVTRFRELLNTQQYLELRLEAVDNDGFSAFLENPNFDFVWPDLKTWDQNRYTDWQEVLIGGTAYRNNAQLSISGGSEQTQFLFSGGYQDETTVFPGDSKYVKVSGRTNINHRSEDNRFKLNVSVNYTIEDNQLPFDDFTRLANILEPNAPALYDDEGNLNWENNTWDNPLANLEREYRAKTNTFFANTVLSYQLPLGLEVKTNLGYNNNQLESYSTLPSSARNPDLGFDSSSSQVTTNNANRQSWIAEPQLNWEQQWSNAKLMVLVGTTYQQQTAQRYVQRGVGFPSDNLLLNLSAAAALEVMEDSDSEYNYLAYFGRINYNWKNKYILNLTGRRDASSRFGPGKQFGNFWAMGSAWVFSEENILKGSPVLSFGKLRASYGTTGSDNIGDYQFLGTYNTTGFDYNGTTALAPTGVFNPNFGWEENKKLELALELGFFNDRVLLNSSWYQNRSSNQLIGVPLPATTGFTSLTDNFDATVENTGLEIDLRSVNVQKEHFAWTTTFNLTVPKNKLLKFPGLETSTFANTYRIGEPLTAVPLFLALGVDSDTGLYTFEDYNDDGSITIEDRKWFEDLAPEFYGGLGNSLSYKNWQFDVFFQFKKQKAYNNFHAQAAIGFKRNGSVQFLNRWQEQGDNSPVQRATIGFFPGADEAGQNQSQSNAALSDASFIRLRNITLKYSLPKEFNLGIDASFYLQAQNLLTITGYDGADPEQPFITVLPPLRQITLGLQIGI